MRNRFPELLLLSGKVDRAHSDSPDRATKLTALLQSMATEMFEHMNKEEQILFPMINAGKSEMVKMPISRMEHEHGKNLRDMKAMTNDFIPPAYACPTWKVLYRGLEELEAELMDHINFENSVLFPKALSGAVT